MPNATTVLHGIAQSLQFRGKLGFFLTGSSAHNQSSRCNKRGPVMRSIVLPVVLVGFGTMGFLPQDDIQTVTASYYQSGEVTANGEKFDPMGHTAAHRRFKFGTILRVENKENGKVVVVRVNDRGPYIDGRSLDLSLGAAQALGMVHDGLAEVEIKVLKRQ
jgi:rare lipoprotein A